MAEPVAQRLLFFRYDEMEKGRFRDRLRHRSMFLHRYWQAEADALGIRGDLL